MIRFEDPIYLWLLLVVPILLCIQLLGWRQRVGRLKKFGDSKLVAALMPDYSKARSMVKYGLLLLTLCVAIFMLARPQMGTKISHEKRNGIETIIALDISNSMEAEDVAPSRLAKSKLMIENLVDNFVNDKIGLVVFAGDAFVQLPITGDYVSAKMFLQNIDPSLISSQGTNISEAIRLSMNSFTQKEHIGRAIIVITDGEDHEGGAIEMAKEANKKGINVFILGIGDVKGAPIPLGDGSYLKDNTGAVVMTKLNDDMCKQLAQAGKGTYIHVDNTGDAQSQLNNELAKLQKSESDTVVYSQYDEQFQAFGIILLLLLIAEVCILEVKSKRLEKYNLFKRRR